MKSKLLIEICQLRELKSLHFRIILILMNCRKEASQIELAEDLNLTKQNINRAIKDLRSMDIVIQSRKVGTTIFWKLNPEPKLEIKGQMKMNL